MNRPRSLFLSLLTLLAVAVGLAAGAAQGASAPAGLTLKTAVGRSAPPASAVVRPDPLESVIRPRVAAHGYGRIVVATGVAAEEESAVESAVVHGNSRLSPRTTHLYRLSDENGSYLKTGITSNPGGRYSQKFLIDKRLDFLTSGSRSEMLNLERFIVERDPGPWNFERWAGDFSGDVP
jgi:hypothetical protein